MMSFSDMDYWRLSEILSVTNAAMLAADIDPGVMEPTSPSNPINGHFHVTSMTTGFGHRITYGRIPLTAFHLTGLMSFKRTSRLSNAACS